MIRLILFIIIFAFFLIFIVLNLDNRCDISIGFKIYKDIPVFLSSLFSFILGMLFAVPLVFSLRKMRKKPSGSESSNTLSPGGAKKRLGKRGAKSTTAEKSYEELSSPDDYNKEKSPYGID